MRQVDKRAVLSEMALDLLLLMLIQGGFLWSLRCVYGLNLSVQSFLLRAVLPAVAVPWILVRLPKRRFFLLSAAVLLALTGWYWHAIWLSGGCQLLQQALTALAVPVEVESQWLTGSARDVLWTITYFALLLSMTLGMTVLLIRSAALTWALTGPWLVPAVVFERELSWVGLLALTLGGCLLLLTGRSHRFDRAGSVRQAWVALPPLLVALGLVTALLPRQEYQRPQWTEGLRAELEAASSGLMQEGILGNLGAALPGGDQVSVSLSSAGPRTFRENVVLEVESDYHGTVYLRGTSAAVYTGQEWADLPEQVYENGLGDDGQSNSVQGFAPVNFPALASGSSRYYELTITYPRSLSGWMFTPYQLLSRPDEIMDVSFVNDTHLQRDFGIRTKNVYFIPPEEIQVLSRNTQWEAAVAEAEYRQFVYENYLDVPDGFGETYRRFMEAYSDLVGSGNDHKIDSVIIIDSVISGSAYENRNQMISGEEPFAVLHAKVIANMLAMMTEYNLNTPLTPEGEDFVDYFLNESHQGYCVHYASAGTLMLRYSGIPARYVTGYLTKIPASGKVEVLDSDAHAWVEIYLDGYGWYPVEMTPPSEIGLAPGEGIGETAPEPEEPTEPDVLDEEPEATEETPEQSIQQPKPETADTPEQPTEEPTEESGDAWVPPPWVFWTMGALLVVALFPIHSWYCTRRRERQFYDSDYSGAVIAMYRHLEQLQSWGTDPTTLQSLAQKAQYSRQGITEEERRQAALLWLREREKLNQLPKLRRFWLRWIVGIL
ncbi:transglutaminase-like domain-containing protein [Candidatus Avoscillospira sp. LCP25S3_F1]|uniref:transglutaminase-like domain-containing protein n=1 Tax=Candidatus Avoscillospira sp. LCP25S3_F1 TaxID=3438825 RepID=UPI003F8DA613